MTSALINVYQISSSTTRAIPPLIRKVSLNRSIQSVKGPAKLANWLKPPKAHYLILNASKRIDCSGIELGLSNEWSMTSKAKMVLEISQIYGFITGAPSPRGTTSPGS